MILGGIGESYPESRGAGDRIGADVDVLPAACWGPAMRTAAIVAVLAACAAPLARADEPTPVSLATGDRLNLCKAQLAHCPVSAFVCDDPKVAVMENGPEGVELKGISPGTTLCSVLGFERTFRRVIRVTVKAGAGWGGGVR